MKYVIFVLAFSLFFSPIVNLNQGLIPQDEIEKIFNNLTPDLMGNQNNSNLLIRNISTSN
ncbi:hypothetical protein [Candidatus Nitrosocosmicus arcticus]|uniref:Uncharacterized protein n=1 Tax=Candidatus Nitrosocosmicus arcticus TaxID=2035267 RepID=A0A557SRY3_9ARCH|nr:hypothetical protein [Candidatus Nitrosocosmicus arcticus]TVP39361.1 hypothetical protein NARC_160075 [Candidatus Nitrosocosmicus arcticus]